MIGKRVLIRTYSAGVHFGTLVSIDGDTATLKDSRRIWRWFGALDCSALSQIGPDPKRSTISVVVPNLIVKGVIEVHEASESACAKVDATEASHESSR